MLLAFQRYEYCGEARVMRVRPHGEARVMRVRLHGEARVMRVRPHGAKAMQIAEVQSLDLMAECIGSFPQ